MDESFIEIITEMMNDLLIEMVRDGRAVARYNDNNELVFCPPNVALEHDALTVEELEAILFGR